MVKSGLKEELGATHWSNPITAGDDDVSDDEMDPTTGSDANAGKKFTRLSSVNPLGTESVDFEGGYDSDDGAAEKAKRTVSAKAVELDPAAQAARARAHNKIAILVRQEEFGEADLDDLDLDPDLVSHMKEWCGLKHPRTRQSLTYDVAQFVLLLYIVAWVPWRIAFETETLPNQFIFWWDIFIDLALVFDMFLCMHRYYFDDVQQKLVTDPRTIRNNYLRGWFVVDLVSVVPFDFVIRYTMKHDPRQESLARSAKMVRLVRLARFAKILRLAKLASLRKHTKSIQNKIRELGVGHQGAEFCARVLVLTVIVYIILHVVACLWIFQARLQCQDGTFPSWYAIEYRDTVGVDYDNSSYIDDWELQQSPFLGLDPQNLASHPENVRVYIDGIYLVLVTMGQVGYGDNIRPFNEQERFACSITIVAGAFVWAYIIGTFDTALAMMDRDKATFDEWMRQIKAMLKFYDVPYLLEQKIDQFFEFKYEGKTLFRDEDIMDQLPDRLRRDLQLFRFREVIRRIPFFVDLHDDVVVEVVERMVGFTVLPGDYVFHKGDPYPELIVLKKGRLAVVREDTKDFQPEWGTAEYNEQMYNADTMEAEYFPGAFFGEAQFLGFDQQRECSIRARTFCECFSLHPEDMEPVLRMHPTLKKRLTHYSKMKNEIQARMLEDLWLEEMKAKLHDAAEGVGGWRSLFESMDADDSGELDSGEFRRALRAAGVAADVVDDTAARRMFLMIDRDNSGTVDVEELIEVLSDEVLHSDDPITRMLVFHKEIEEEMDHERDDLRQVFEKHAVEGHVVKDELIALCADLDRPLKNWEVEAAWRTMDPDEHGWVEFEEFSAWYSDTDGRVQAVRSKAELWRRTAEQFQEASLAEQKELARRIKYVDRRLQEHVAEWAELMALFRAKYGAAPPAQGKAGTVQLTEQKKQKKSKR